MVDLNLEDPNWGALEVLENIRIQGRLTPDQMVEMIGQTMDEPTETWTPVDVTGVLEAANSLISPSAETNLDQWLEKNREQQEELGMTSVISIMLEGPDHQL